VSTRAKGAEPPVILVTAKATFAAGAACLRLTERSGPMGARRNCLEILLADCGFFHCQIADSFTENFALQVAFF